jgi:hypothetical protein
MNACKRLLAVVTMFLCLAVFLASSAGAIGIWIVKAPVRERLTHIYGRIESALDFADQSLEQVQASLARAAERLETVKEDQRKAAQDPQRAMAVRRIAARTVQRQIAPDLSDAHEKVHKIAEGIVVANSVLEDIGGIPFFETLGVDVERLAEINRRLSQVESSAWELTRLLGDPDAESDGELSRVEQVLQTLQKLIAEYATRVTETRHRIEELKANIFRWLMPATILISATLFWIALSQISLFCHARAWMHKNC